MRTRLYVPALLLLGYLSTASWGLITRLTSLADLISEASQIVVAEVDAIDPARPSLTLTVSESLKGKLDVTSLPILLEGDARAKKLKETPQLLKRLARKQKVVLFIRKLDKEFAVLAFTEGTWFSLTGASADGEVRWALAHLEPYLRRTYAGTTKDLLGVVRDVLDGKQKPPPPDGKAKPGLGPEISDKKSGGCVAVDEQLHGVIVAPIIIGPLALLATMFPTVFGGWQRWLVLISVSLTNSTLMTLQWWFSDSLAGRSWWGSPTALWMTMTVTNVLGLAWAWNRHAQRVQFGEAPLLAGRVELALLVGLSLFGLGMLTWLRYAQQPLFGPQTLPVVTFVAAVWVGLLYVSWTWLRGRRIVPAFSTEAVVLTALALLSIVLVPTGGQARPTGDANVSQAALLWTFRLPEKGAICSTPLVAGERVYVAAANDSVFRPWGTVYCLDRATGQVVWAFDDGKKMKQVFSSPVVVDNRLYIGEGFHEDLDCKVYCLDAATGKKLAEFQTGSHTESTPSVVEQRVYIGAGDDGIYCLDNQLNQIWTFGGFHIDADPLVAGKYVYAGCGVGDVHKTTAVLCLDKLSGKPVWRNLTALPVWGKPIVVGDRVFVGTGNGRLNMSDEKPAGGVQAFQASNGESIWAKKMPDGVLGRLGHDATHLFVGCRDGYLSSVRQSDGLTVWRVRIGTAVVTAPIIEQAEGRASRVYAVSIDGLVRCLDASTGEETWKLDLMGGDETLLEVIASPVLDARPSSRHLYVGMTLQSSARIGELRCYSVVSSPEDSSQ